MKGFIALIPYAYEWENLVLTICNHLKLCFSERFDELIESAGMYEYYGKLKCGTKIKDG